MRWCERNLRGHIRVGPLTIYGFNAMKCALNLRTKWGYICFRPTGRLFGRKWGWYFYVSRNGTPWAATVLIGSAVERRDRQRADRRRRFLRHLHGRKWLLLARH